MIGIREWHHLGESLPASFTVFGDAEGAEVRVEVSELRRDDFPTKVLDIIGAAKVPGNSVRTVGFRQIDENIVTSRIFRDTVVELAATLIERNKWERAEAATWKDFQTAKQQLDAQPERVPLKELPSSIKELEPPGRYSVVVRIDGEDFRTGGLEKNEAMGQFQESWQALSGMIRRGEASIRLEGE